MNKIMILFSVIVLLIITAVNVSAWDLPASFDIYQVSFYNSISLKVSNNNYITDPEWADGGSTNNEFAYIRNTNPTVKTEFYCDVVDQDFSNVTIIGIKYMGLPNWSLNAATVSFAASDSISYESSFTTSGSVPGSVCKSFISWFWTVTKKDGVTLPSSQTIGVTSHYFYVVLTTPIAPMAAPWTSVLDRSCVWANGETTASGCVSDLASGLYNYDEVYYNEDADVYSSTSTLNLSGLLSNFDTADTTRMDCRDFTHFFNVVASSLGANTRYKSITPGTGAGEKIDTNSLLPAGWSSSTTTEWNFHYISSYNTSYVVDAAAKYDDNGWVLSSGNISENDYEDLLTQENVNFSSASQTTVY